MCIELIVTSHLLRARETAELIREELGGELPLVVDPRLAETHRGEWETRRFSSIMREEPVAWKQYREHPKTFRFPGGESLADQQRRVLAALRDAARRGRRALLVTHGGSIRRHGRSRTSASAARADSGLVTSRPRPRSTPWTVRAETGT